MKKLIGLALLATSGCASYSHISDEKDAWVVKNIRGEDNRLFYCRSNSDNGGESMPICNEALIVDLKSKFDSRTGKELPAKRPLIGK